MNLNLSFKKIIIISISFVISTLLIKLLLKIRRANEKKNREIKYLKHKYNKCKNNSSSSSSSS